MKTTRWTWTVGISTLIAGCAVDGDFKTGMTSDQPLVLTAATPVAIEGILEYGTVVFAENPTTLMEGRDFHGYEFDGRAGGNVTITMTGQTCGIPDTVLHLFGPADVAGNRGLNLAENDDAALPCAFDSRITNFTLPVNGRYLIVATSFLQQGGNRNYRLTLTCNNAACTLPGAITFASSKILQTSIDSGSVSADTLFNTGEFLFETNYQTNAGLGNALTALPANNTARPNFRPFPNNVHFAAFGAPEAQSCVTCHNVGGDDGAGDLNHNIFQIGDGTNPASGLPRNPPQLLGSGLRQAIAAEMTAELQAQRNAGLAQANATNTNVTVALNAKTRGFGSVVARPDGTVDFTLLSKAVDSDLVVKPFGWKGREATIRRFIEGGFRVHFGMQTEPSVNKHCITPNVNTFGTGANCQDPDGDGVTKEISDGQLSATAVYMTLLEMPVRIPAATAAEQTRVNQGEALFNQVNCQACHTQNMTINSPFHTEKGDTTTGAGIRLNLGTSTRLPRPAVSANGSMTVEIWSDFRRHDMGLTDCDPKPFNQIAACFFMTPPLWGIRYTAPYWHDGRALTLLGSILMHDGEALNSINAFKALSADDQLKITDFLGQLGRIDYIPTPPPNDFSITPSPTSRTVIAGTSATYTINTTVTSGSAQSIALSVASSLPTGVTASFNPASVVAGGSSTLTLTTSPTTTSGTTQFTITGTSSRTTHSVPASISVNGDFSITPAPTSQTVIAGTPATYTINTAVTSGSAQSIALSVASSLPTGVTASFNPASVVAGGSSTLTLTTSATTSAGTTQFTITGTAPSSTAHTVQASVTVTPNQSPTVTITSPANGSTVSGLVTVSANASDADGTVVSLKLDLPNGTSVDANNSASLSTTWDSTTVPDASAYVIRATATDNLGAISVATVTIAVDGPTTRDLPATDVPKPIPDRDFLGVSSVIDVPAGLDILNVTVDVAITHPAYGELSIQLIGPNSETVVLHNVLIGESGNFVLVGFDISSNFALGSPAAGQWKLFVQDVSQGFTGTIDLFALHIRSSH